MSDNPAYVPGGALNFGIDPAMRAMFETKFDEALRGNVPLVEHLEFIVSEIDSDPATLHNARLHWVGIYLLRLIARERGLLPPNPPPPPPDVEVTRGGGL